MTKLKDRVAGFRQDDETRIARVARAIPSVRRQLTVYGVDWDISAGGNIMRSSYAEPDDPWGNDLERALSD